MKVAIVHYWLFHMRGGEKVLEALCDLYPQADIFTHVYDPRRVSESIRRHKVETTFIQRLPFARKHYKKYLPLMPAALEQIDLSSYDLVISSEAGPSKGVIVRPDAFHVCYCHSPMRYIWDQYHNYRRSAGLLERAAMPWLMPHIRQWDVTCAARVDHFIANSSCVADRIMRYWRREAEVIAPPVDVDRFRPRDEREDFYLYVGELTPYKRADLAIAACTALGRRLVVIGGGSEERKLRNLAGPTIEFLGHAPDNIVEDFLTSCRALIFPTEEDFGIVPVEAMAAGAPVIAFGRGGSRDTIVDGQTGVFFGEQSLGSTIEGIIRFEMMEQRFDRDALAARAALFRREVFAQKFTRAVKAAMEMRHQNRPFARPLPARPTVLPVSHAQT